MSIQPQRVKQSTKTSTKAAVKISTDAQLVTSAQSLSIVRTLVQTGIGVITYLRGIFPDECFNDDRIGPDRSETTHGSESRNTEVFKKDSREGRGYIRVKKIRPGASPESDVVLNYLDEGVMDAIQRGYLRQLLFAMYLDPENPRDVIECYTFNFTYSSSTLGEARLIPELEVRDQLKEMSLTGKVTISEESNGKALEKTGGMVKRQIQTLIKNLICSTQSLSDINGRRFLSFKLYYNDKCPMDYQPPHFDAGDVEKDRFTFGTAGREEIPNATEMGKVDTGYHTVRVALATISNFLPDNVAPGLSKRHPNEAEGRESYLEKIRAEAKNRKVVWDTEMLLDPPSSPSPTSNPNLVAGNEPGSERINPEPLGLRDSQGKIIPLSNLIQVDQPIQIWQKKTDSGRDPGNSESSSSVMDSTQVEDNAQVSPRVGDTSEKESTTAKRVEESSSMDIDIPTINLIKQAKTLGLGKLGKETIENESLLLLDTQGPAFNPKDLEQHLTSDSGQLYSLPIPELVQEAPQGYRPNPRANLTPDDPIQAFSQAAELRPSATLAISEDPIEGTDPKGSFLAEKTRARASSSAVKQTQHKKRPNAGPEPIPSGPDTIEVCECKDWHDDSAMIACEVCVRWRHLSCYGYKSLDDPRIPVEFICYRCRIHEGLSLEDTWKREDEIKTALEGLRTLCIFRRALQIIYEEGMPTAIKQLAKRLETDFTTASQLKKRLMAENYLCPKASEKSKASAGILESETGKRSKSVKDKGNKKSLVVNESYEQKKVRDAVYFTPGSELESKILGAFSAPAVTVTTAARDSIKSVGQSKEAELSADITTRTRSWTQLLDEENREQVDDLGMQTSHESSTAKVLSKSDARLGSDQMHDRVSGRLRSVDRTPQPSKRRKTKSGETRRRSRIKDKVSIGIQEVEVAGVTWDDVSD
ncbi:hypothetical protein CROQUDRAFT_77014 [Cronartium quercuum f. sp. fusiforme G11]|uniref:HORMA domain-containing protein n=1 Tax=Cronartium quercuum f. sp. fusiforme G11 TaxID=708437 RepID=A0A9P6NP56_9BASI|nr:hypothetical protein CROQUDRAFT_77014 [Cronartium quercuum f. sp. fusiforme G11]